jgi:hypothetical protein
MLESVDHTPNWDYQHGHVEGYLNAMGYNIVSKRDCQTCVDFEEKTVFLNSRFSPEVQFYLLLHSSQSIHSTLDMPAKAVRSHMRAV